MDKASEYEIDSILLDNAKDAGCVSVGKIIKKGVNVFHEKTAIFLFI